ncbi:hypothetical protein Fmac_018957 [Flemingia macrophylla]|uniref:CLAVATA3/ESR (CLE)-related protein n=1 Tax=Flemingia macrophylla TaxID=520843 RepID=A0ABD1M6J3_9FABA
MASLRMMFKVLFLASMLICHGAESHPSSLSESVEKHAFVERTKTVLKEIRRRKMLLGTQYKPNRLSPGGPDPHHH